jgi:hypothetical protein
MAKIRSVHKGAMITWNFVAKAEIEDERTRPDQVFKARSGCISTTDLNQGGKVLGLKS